MRSLFTPKHGIRTIRGISDDVTDGQFGCYVLETVERKDLEAVWAEAKGD